MRRRYGRFKVKRSKAFHVGCQSWGYDDWITRPGGEFVFYPRGTKRDEMLTWYSRVFDTIEVDSTVYGLPPVSNFESWYAKTPPGFLFSLKLPREITHERFLDDTSLPILDEFLRRAAAFKEKLGILLIQLPAKFDNAVENGQNLRKFLSYLPSEFRFAIEFRNPEWLIEWTFEELEKNRVTLALVEGPWVPRQTMFDAIDRVVKEFAYVRLMAQRDLKKFDRVYRDRTAIIELWIDNLRRLNSSEFFIYCDNYLEGNGPATAWKVQRAIGLPTIDPAELEDQPSLF
jgi:uncharacterized protein YecE (DUF72 family)